MPSITRFSLFILISWISTISSLHQHLHKSFLTPRSSFASLSQSPHPLGAVNSFLFIYYSLDEVHCYHSLYCLYPQHNHKHCHPYLLLPWQSSSSLSYVPFHSHSNHTTICNAPFSYFIRTISCAHDSGTFMPPRSYGKAAILDILCTSLYFNTLD